MNKLYLTLSLLFGLHLFAFSQSDSTHITTIANKLEKLSATRPVEKVYLHLNKPAYNTGDTIWFKGYVTVGGSHQPSALSGILYVELINDKDRIVKSLQLKSVSGLSAGDIALTDKLTPGDYRLRAYTNWMRNAGADYFYTKTININNTKTGAVFITSSIDLSGKGGDGAVIAKLNYTDKFGRAFDHKTVTYEVKADTTILYKGTGITDDKGNLSISFSDKAAAGQKRLNIINHIKLVNNIIADKTIPVSLQKENVDIQFFPEGGQLVNGVRSKVAFKAISPNGLGAAVKGVVVDNDNNEAAVFETQHAGMGIFALAPQIGKTYTAKITLADNSTVTAQLPQAADKGFVLAVNSADSTKLTIRVATNAATLDERKGQSFYLVGQSAGVIYYTTAGKLDNASFSATVPKSKFPTGIAQFTLFSSANEPLNERVVFIQNPDLLGLNLSTSKTAYAQKEKVNMSLLAKDKNSKPVSGSFSLAVFNEDKISTSEDAESTILTNILLTSDLKGYIEEPGYYFNNSNEQTRADADILMLTQGYRRFEWKEIMSDRYPALTYKPEKSLSISGVLTNTAGKPLIKGKLSVLALANAVAVDTVTDNEGRFNLPGIELPDSTKLVIQARKANDGKNVNITLNNSHTIPIIYKSSIADASQNIAPPYLSMMTNGGADTAQLATDVKANTVAKPKTLKEVTISEKKEAPPSLYNGYGSVYQYNLDMAQARNYNSIYDAVKLKIPGVSYVNGRLYYEGTPIGKTVLNGFEFPGTGRLSTITPDDVEYLSLSAGVILPGTRNKKPVPVIILTTKSFSGSDTVNIKEAGTAGVAKSKVLNNVDVKANKINKADESNLFGSTKPLVVLSGTKLANYATITSGIIANSGDLHLKNEKVYDAIPPKNKKAPQPPIPVVIDGLVIAKNLNIDDVINVDQIENIKIVQGAGFKPLYGIAIDDPNDKVIVITTKNFAGTNVAPVGDTIRKVNLKDVTIKARKNAGSELNPWQEDVKRSANLNGPGHADMVFGTKDLQNCADFLECLIAKIPGITTNNGNYYFVRHAAQSITSPPPIQFMLDGQLATIDQLSSLNVNDILTVEILNSSSYLNVYGTQASGGLFIITSKLLSSEGNSEIAYKSVPGVIYTKFNGFYLAKEFYTPKYTAKNLTTPDPRTAIYWNPNITTDAKGTFPVEYFNSDIKGTYRAVIEGIDNDGNIGRYVYRYMVQ